MFESKVNGYDLMVKDGWNSDGQFRPVVLDTRGVVGNEQVDLFGMSVVGKPDFHDLFPNGDEFTIGPFITIGLVRFTRWMTMAS
jgi:hypothetical protein